MMANSDFEGNALDITDEEVASDWRLGLIRSLGSVVAGSALPLDSMERWGRVTPGSNRAHLAYPGLGSTETQCSITEVYNIREDSFEEWEHSSFGDENRWTRTELKALATCACGRLVRHPVTMTIGVGDLIYTVTHAV